MYKVTSVVSTHICTHTIGSSNSAQHWHGIYQNGSNYADGMSMVTQCPIAQNHSFLYSFSAQEQTGTFWYHSHYSTQTWFVDLSLLNLMHGSNIISDGLRGPLIIYDPEDPLGYLYDVDDGTAIMILSVRLPKPPTESTVITLADWYISVLIAPCSQQTNWP